MGTTWFTADLHLGHRNILTHVPERGEHYADIEAMDAAAIKLWRSLIEPGDTVYHVGDLTLAGIARTKGYLAQLTGDVILLPGNHDMKGLRKLARRTDELPANVRVEYETEGLELEIAGQRLLLCHWPKDEWEGQDGWDGVWHLHGHSHGNAPRMEGRVDVGWDPFPQFVEWGALVTSIRALRMTAQRRVAAT